MRRISGVALAAGLVIGIVGTAGAQIDSDGLEDLRECEATGSYTAVDPSGSYFGAYQFAPGTWDVVAEWLTDQVGSEYLQWSGVRPDLAPPEIQDLFARTLWNNPQLGGSGGPGNWPVCQHEVEDAPVPSFAGMVTL